MPNKVHVKKGDTVVVISGKYKGKQGKVLTVLPKDKKVVVEGVNIVKKHVSQILRCRKVVLLLKKHQFGHVR